MKNQSAEIGFSELEVSELKEALSKLKETPENESKIFPHWPANPSEREQKRNELMIDLNKWDNNDPLVARWAAKTMMVLLAEQFKLEFQFNSW